jgi:phenylpropionate dioxygenase-like ring-hydroxylating dioxygenase large terminal subunit
MSLKNAWYVAAWDTEVTPEALFSRRILGIPIVFFRGDNGMAAALEDKCCHRLAPLSHGQREGNCVRCMYHGLMFDTTGRCVEVPGQERIGAHLRVRSFPLVERDRLLWIWMGDPSRADPSRIHDSHWHDCDDYKARRGGYIHYESAVQLIADNLLDFSHLAFVHNKSIGTRKFAEVKPDIESLDEAVRITYFTPDAATAPFARALSRLPATTDRYQFYTWNLRGCYFSQDSVTTLPGAGSDTSDPQAMRLHTMIALTPETETTTHYFWSTAHNDFNPGFPELTSRLATEVGRAFDEDKQIIEAQQRVIKEFPDSPMMAIRADIALTGVRRMLDKLLLEEATAERGSTAASIPPIVAAAESAAAPSGS